MHTDPETAELADGIARAAECGDPNLLREFITQALSGKRLHALAAQPAFREHVLHLSEHARGRGEAPVLTMLSELGRLHRYLRPNDNWLIQLATTLLTPGFQPSPVYGTSAQRLCIADVVSSSSVDVSLDGIARAAIEEKTAEKVRSVWVRLLLSKQSLSGTLDHLTDAIGISNDTAMASADSWLRRLHRVLTTLDAELQESPVKLDNNITASLGRFVAAALSRSSTPQDYDVSSESATTLLKFSQRLVLLSERLRTDPSFYGAVARARTWFPAGGWVRFTRASETLAQLRRVLLDGIVLLLDQGKPDPELLAAHRSLSPDTSVAKAELSDLATQSRHLSDELRQWLRSSGRNRIRPAAVELRQTDDLAIAFALITARKLRQDAVDIRRLLDELDIIAPIQAHIVRQFAATTTDLLDRLDTLATRRRLRVFGTCGDIVDFSPHAYKLADGAPLSRRVRVTSPGVEEVGERTAKVLVHALVEPVNGRKRPDH